MKSGNKQNIKRFFQENSILMIIGILQVIPLILRLIPCLKDKDWVSMTFNTTIIIVVICLREKRRRKFSKQTDNKIQKLSGDTMDLSSSTITISGKVETLSSWLTRLETRVYDLEHHKGYSTIKPQRR